MKAAVLFGPGDLRITDFPEPKLERDGVKIAVAYCGLCGTDFHKFAGKGGSRPVTYPVPLGHEVSGIVEDVGEDVTAFQRGDRVTVDPNWSCGQCWYCRSGKRHLCGHSRGVVKGMAEYVCPPQENVYRLPDTLSLSAAALTEPLACCLHGVDQLGIQMGEVVAIVGLGAIGQLMLQLCRRCTAKVVVIEPIEEKRKAAMELGAALFINPNTEDAGEALRRAGISCVEKVIECGGNPSAVELALNIAGRGATVVLFGVGDRDSVVPFRQYDAFAKELTIRTSYINPYTTSRAIELLNQGVIDMEHTVSGVIELEELPQEVVSRRYSRMGKVLVRIGADTDKV